MPFLPLTELVNKTIQGDILTILKRIPDNTVDLTITSPPYNKKNKNTGWLVQINGYANFNDQMPEDKYQEWQLSIINELYRITKPGGSFFYNHKIRWDDGLMFHPYSWISRSTWTIRQELIWDRAIAANVRGWRFYQTDERIYWLYKPVGKYLIGTELKSKHAKMSSIWRMAPARRTDNHPAPFPLELPARIIYSLLDENKGIILDPFCGTGTTLVAAKLLGHDYIGIDISEEYINFTNQRLEHSQDEMDLIVKEKEKHIVRDPFVNRKDRGTVSWPYKEKKRRPKKIAKNESESSES